MDRSTVGFLVPDSVLNSTAIPTGATISYSSSSSFFTNYPLISAYLAFAIAQSLKLVASCSSSWGRAVCHRPITALAVAVGLREGFGGSLFAVTLILAFVVMYDVTGVRLHAGRQAEVLNQIVYELPAEHPLAETRPLRELLGHTHPQVCAGAVLGLFIATIGHLISGFGSTEA